MEKVGTIWVFLTLLNFCISRLIKRGKFNEKIYNEIE